MNYFRNAIAKLYDAISAPVASTRDALNKKVVNYLRLLSVENFPWYVPEEFRRETGMSKLLKKILCI